MDGRDPVWSPDEHLERVYQRGRQLRRRRRALLTSGTVGTLVLLVAAFTLVSAAGPGQRVRTAANPGATTSSPDRGAPAPDTSTTTAGGAVGGSPSTTVSPGGTGAPPPVGAKSRPGQVGSVTTTTPTTTPPAGSPPPDSVGPCASSDLDYTTTTGKSTYGPGESVAISIVAYNHSGHTCDGPTICGMSPWAEVRNSAGQVWRNSPMGVMCTNPPPTAPRLAPGQSHAYPAGTWDQQTCGSGGACSQASAGTYRAIAHWGDVVAAAAKFTTR